MDLGERSCCCISHMFRQSASRFPDKVAVIHASGFARLSRDQGLGNDEAFVSGGTKSLSNPPVYGGDEFFTFSDVLGAVENLSFRLRCIVDGAQDAGLIVPRVVGISSGTLKEHQNMGSLNNSSSRPQESASLRNTRTPKIIGIFMEPSVEYIVALLSILKCGETFMPLDPTWPKARILSLISTAKVNIIIGCKTSTGKYSCHNIDKIKWLIDSSTCPILPISMEDNMRKNYEPCLSWPCESECLRSFCYLMYTSGSSGEPKGVCGTEIGLLNRFMWMQRLYPVDERDVILFKTPISFIDHLQEILGAMLTTCTLVIPPFSELRENILSVIGFLKGYSITRLVAVPSLIRSIIPDLQTSNYALVKDYLKLLVISGEVLHVSLCELILKSLPQTQVLNLYGSTEVSGDCMYFDCNLLPQILKNDVLESVPIGLPISDCDLVLVGEDAPTLGEIYVRGSCVAIGYFDHPYIMPLDHAELPPQHKFECHGDENNVRPYFKTGDIARKLPSGDLVFLGRKDRTIKFNGHRIALEEIERKFREHPDVVETAVVFHGLEGEIQFLEAHILLKQMNGEKFSTYDASTNESLRSSLRSWIQSKLPHVMVPSIIEFTNTLPLTSSGKVDYTLLSTSRPSNIHPGNIIREIPLVDRIHVIQKAFSDALMIEKISVDDNFFEMGGDSISAAYASFKLGIHMKELYNFPTPLKLWTALSAASCAVTSVAVSGVDAREAREGMSFSFKHRIPGYHETNPRFRLLGSRSFEDDPSKQLQATKKIRTRVNDFWNLRPPAHSSCSFSRCNKSEHGQDCQGNYLPFTFHSDKTLNDKKVSIQELWRCGLGSCVDASPLLVFTENDIRLFIGSHSFKFVSLDALSGNVFWETKLQGRVECSAAFLDEISQVVVGCYHGIIYFLDFFTGFICWDFQTGGEVKSQPLVDKCRQLVWCGSYDHYLYAIDYKRHKCVYKLQCCGSIFGSPVIDEIEEILFVASTSGHVTAVSIKVVPFNMIWRLDLEAPIFGSLSINSSEGNVICCLVDGTVVVLNNAGFISWKASTGGPIFAGPSLSDVLSSQVLVCSRDGNIYSFQLDTGALLWKHDIGHPISSSPFVDEGIQLIDDESTLSYRLLCVCDSSGSIHVLQIDLEALGTIKNVVREFARLDLKGEIFSSPIMIGGRIFVGCRDDNVYCLKLGLETET